MKDDPFGETKPDKLQQMKKDNPSPEVLEQRVRSQLKDMERDLKKQEEELKKVNEALEYQEN